MRRNLFFVLLVLSAILIPMNVKSGECSESAVLSTKYTERFPARFGYGFMNTVFGWTALGVAPYQAHQEGAGAGDSFGRAVTHPFAHTLLGIWDLCTFWVPGEVGRSMAVPRHVWMPRRSQTALVDQGIQPALADGSDEITTDSGSNAQS